MLQALRRHWHLKGGDLRLLQDGALRLLTSFDYPPENVDLLQDVDVATSPLLSAKAVRRRRLLTHDDEHLTPERLRTLERQGVLDDRYVFVPVTYHDEPLGLLSLTFPERRAFRPDELETFTAIAKVVGQAVANGLLFEAEQRRAERMAALKAIAESAGASLRLRDVGDRLIAAVQPILGTASALVAVEQDGHLMPVASSGYPDGFVRERLTPLPDASLAAQAYRTAKPRVVNDRRTADLSGWSRDTLQRLGHGAFLGLPLLNEGKAFGAVAFIWSAPRSFDADELAFLESIVAAAATGLQHALLFEAERAARRQAGRELVTSQALLEAADAIAEWTDLGQLPTRLARLLLRLTGRRRVLVGLWHEPDGTLEIVAAEGAMTPPIGVYPLADCSQVMREVLLDGRTRVSDFSELPPEQRGRVLGPRGGELVAHVPMQWRDTVAGLIVLDDPGERREFRARDLQLAEGVAAQAAVAIENAALFEQAMTRDRLSTALNGINELIHSTLRVDEIMQRVVEQARRAVGSDGAMVAVPRGDGWVAEFGAPEPGLIHQRVRTDEAPFILTAVRERRPVAIADCAHDPRCIPEVQARFGVLSVLCIPLIAHDEVLGVIFFNRHQQAAPFEELVIDFADKLAVVVSSALENARLFEEQQRIATTLQQNFVHTPPTVEGLEFGVRSQPANQPELVGGDFGDIFELPDGRVAVIIADVAGKGLRAAGLTETVRSTSAPTPPWTARRPLSCGAPTSCC